MHELLRTNDAVLVTYVEALLNDAGVSFHVADVNISFAEGSIGAFPRRILVMGDDLAAARRILADAGLAAELSTQSSGASR
jgi:hypothetical protein